MKELRAIFDILNSNTEPGVLATLVEVDGSSYRRVGARLLWRPGQERIGSISGGCLEEDLIERAREVLRKGQREVVIYDTTGENDLVWGVGLGCHGIVRVLLEPVSGLPLHLKLIETAWARREAAVLSLAFGNSPAPCGPLGALSASGASWGEPAGRSRDSLDEARRSLAAQKSHYTRAGADSDAASVLWEYLPPPLRLMIFGAGDDAKPLVRLAKELGWEVEVIDPRPAYATRERFPQADQVRVLPPDDSALLAWDPLSVAVVMTHHYRFDLPYLRGVLPLKLRYVGLLGPKKRAQKILGDLEKERIEVSAEARERLHAPVGLDLGGSSPEEVALAIIAEIQGAMMGREARPLRERTRPIHG